MQLRVWPWLWLWLDSVFSGNAPVGRGCLKLFRVYYGPRGEWVGGVGWSCKKCRDVALFPLAHVSQAGRWVAIFLHLLPLLISPRPLLFLLPWSYSVTRAACRQPDSINSRVVSWLFTLSPHSVVVRHLIFWTYFGKLVALTGLSALGLLWW